MRGKTWSGMRLNMEDVLAYVAVLLMVGLIYKVLPASATSGMVWGILWRTIVILGLVVVPMVVVGTMIWKYIQLSRKVS